MPKRKILALTGIRSEYDILSSVLRAIEEHPALSLSVAVTGAHLSKEYGLTVREIEKDGFKIAARIQSLIGSDADSARPEGMAVQLKAFVKLVAKARPDLLLVLGDREEAMTAALAGTYMNVPVAHISGGDRVVGNADDQIRHAVTKLAHLHFATNEESRRRILRLGEQPFRVYNVGNPGLDRLISTPKLSARELSRRLGFPLAEKEPFILLIQHPLSSEIGRAGAQMRATLDAVKKLGLKTILSYPNTDAGSHGMIGVIRKYSRLPFLHVARSLPRLEFVNVMRRASCMLGNSSAGVLEAPLLKLPAVNVGGRQKGRLHADNILFVPHDAALIAKAVKRAVFDEAFRLKVARCRNPYGDGHSSKRIARLLAAIPLNERFRIKDITY